MHTVFNKTNPSGSGYNSERRMNQRTIARQITLIECIGKGRFGEVSMNQRTIARQITLIECIGKGRFGEVSGVFVSNRHLLLMQGHVILLIALFRTTDFRSVSSSCGIKYNA